MALRRVASELANGLGIRYGTSLAPMAESTSFGLRALLARGYATVIPNAKYAKSHEYAAVDGDVATIGISDFAQAELGDVVYVELPPVGDSITKGETFGVVESVKAASDVYAPISGEVVEVNETLSDEPALVNSEPYAKGWFVKIKVADKGELDALMDAATYEKHCAESH